MTNHDTLAFIEVKARTSDEPLLDMSHFPLTSKQIKRVTSTAMYFLSCNDNLSDLQMRFDVILLNGKEIADHIENAWMVDENYRPIL